MICLISLGACSTEDSSDELIYEKNPAIVFHIRSLSSETSSSSIEKVKSLRIIIVSDGYVEYNKWVELEKSADGFNYEFVYNTVPGKKDFYLFANEESVNEIWFEDTELPEELQNPSLDLKKFLDYFNEVDLKDENLDESVKQGVLLENLINKLYFIPEYNNTESEIFLPYSASYTGEFGIEILKDSPVTNYDAKMYIVPVATKFNFNFINLSDEVFSVTNIALSKINQKNYLMAKVGDSDFKKDFKPINDQTYDVPESDKNLYWIYWLAKVSEASHDNQTYFDNVNFNDTYGWITNYYIPDSDDLISFNFLREYENDIFKVPNSSDENNPQVYSTGTFYVPESKNLIGNSQVYSLRLDFNKNNEKKYIELNLDNLKALFRNTSVKITVTITQGDLKAYAEIYPWSDKIVNGWLKEEKDLTE